MKHTAVAVLAVILVLAGIDAASAKEWLVDRVSGSAWAASSSQQRFQLKPQMKLVEGLTISTSQNGRVRLTSDGSSITMSPGSVAVISSSGLFTRKTQVVQQIGVVEFDVEKRSRPHFSIQTPYLAAVVKGTKFTIRVSSKKATLGVDRGLVHVTDLASGQSADVAQGQRAATGKNGAGLSTAGRTAPEVVQGMPAAPQVAPPGRQLAAFAANLSANASAITSQGRGRASSRGDNESGTSEASSAGTGNGEGNNGPGSSTRAGDGQESKAGKSGQNGGSHGHDKGGGHGKGEKNGGHSADGSGKGNKGGKGSDKGDKGGHGHGPRND